MKIRLIKRTMSIRVLIFALLIIPHIEFYGVTEVIPSLKIVIYMWRLISACFCLPYCIKYFIQKKNKEDYQIVPVAYFLLLLSFSISTIVNGEWERILGLGAKYYMTIVLLLFISIMLRTHTEELMDALLLVCCLIVIINFYTAVRGGISDYYRSLPYIRRIYFLGSKNKSIVYICMAMTVILLHKEMHGKFSLIGFVSFAMCIVTPFFTDSAQGIVVVGAVAVAYVLMCTTRKIRYVITYKNVLIVIGLLLFVMFSENLMFLGGFIEDFLHRSITLSGRTTLVWPQAFKLIQSKPLLGYGFRDDLMTIDDLFIGTHCDYLQFFVYGGFIMFAIFIFTLIALMKCKKCSNIRINAIIYTAIFCFLLNMIVDNLRSWFPVYLIFCFMENVSYISSFNQEYTLKKIHGAGA